MDQTKIVVRCPKETDLGIASSISEQLSGLGYDVIIDEPKNQEDSRKKQLDYFHQKQENNPLDLEGAFDRIHFRPISEFVQWGRVVISMSIALLGTLYIILAEHDIMYNDFAYVIGHIMLFSGGLWFLWLCVFYLKLLRCVDFIECEHYGDGFRRVACKDEIGIVQFDGWGRARPLPRFRNLWPKYERIIVLPEYNCAVIVSADKRYGVFSFDKGLVVPVKYSDVRFIDKNGYLIKAVDHSGKGVCFSR